MLSEPVLVVARIAAALVELGVPYLVGGSLASSVYGVPRATQDVDLVAALGLRHVDNFVSALADGFYVDGDMIREAIGRRASFNVIHLETMFKADIFIHKGDDWSREEMARSRLEQFEVEGATVGLRFASAEDTILHKLVWYRLGNELSDRQWSDILGILKIQGASLDASYLRRWADKLDVAALLSRAQAQALPIA